MRVYNLQDKNDRHDLIHIAFNKNSAQLLNIWDKMWKEGHQGPEPGRCDLIFYNYLGREHYDKMCKVNLEYSCLEADYLKVNKTGPAFRVLCRANRQMMWDSARDLLPELVVGLKIDDVSAVTEREMMKIIQKKHLNT